MFCEGMRQFIQFSILVILYPKMFLQQNHKDINIGFAVEYGKSLDKTKWLDGSMDEAISDINNDPKLLPGYTLKKFVVNSGCNAHLSAGGISKLIREDNVDVIIGPSCSEGCEPCGHLATFHNLTMISYGCSSVLLSDTTIYPTFARTRSYARSSEKLLSKFLYKFLDSMDWRRVALVHSSASKWTLIKNKLDEQLRLDNLTITLDKDFSSNPASVVNHIVTSGSRIVILIMSPEDVVKVLFEARKQNMYDGRYAFISIDFDAWNDWNNAPQWIQRYPRDIFTGLLDVSIKGLDEMGGSQYTTYVNDLQLKLLNAPYHYQAKQVYDAALYLYDAVSAYAKALQQLFNDEYEDFTVTYIQSFLNRTLPLGNFTRNLTKQEIRIGIWPGSHENYTELQNVTLQSINFTVINSSFAKINTTVSVRDGIAILRKLKNLDFKGITGRVKFDQIGDRLPMLQVRNIDKDQKFHKVADYDGITLKYTEPSPNFDYTFPGGSKEKPPDQATCNFKNDPCPVEKKTDSTTVLLAIGIPLGVVILIIVAYYMYKKQKFENDIFNKKSFIKFSDLIIQRNTASMTDSIESLSDIDSVRNGSANEVDVTLMKGNWHRGFQTFLAKYRHETVYVKKLRKVTVPQTRDILLEIKFARDIHHININSYVGFVIEAPQICIISPYCTKGSLRDILQNEDIQLDWIFRVSFMNDISAGMNELHDSGVGAHGNLSSYNILLDNRWLCKIADFGLEKFKDMSDLGPKKIPELSEEEKYKSLMWRSPELLGQEKKKTKQGDVYSFGIIMSEIITRLEPFESYGYKPKDVIHYIQRRCLPPFRPHVRLQSGIDGRILDVMRRCWHEFPAERPTFTEVRKILKKMLKDRNENNDLVDNILAMMEKYTNHLEKRVQERTELLTKEKEKAEKLLYQMLPEVVAQRLKLGEIVKPINYKDVSVLLTDIVGFTVICLQSQPMQVVDLLNDLYSTFDQIIERFDCYKLEPENEKYIVVSGLPKPNGTKNVKFMALMALKLMSKMTTFKIRHMPKTMLRLRICLHHGDVCAGVVGMKTPRYHIFGDDVQFVRHLQMTGPPLAIQISREFNEKLAKLNQFETKMRGPVKVKDKGLVVTYFLTGKEGLDLPMPTPEEDKGVVTNFGVSKNTEGGKKAVVDRTA